MGGQVRSMNTMAIRLVRPVNRNWTKAIHLEVFA